MSCRCSLAHRAPLESQASKLDLLQLIQGKEALEAALRRRLEEKPEEASLQTMRGQLPLHLAVHLRATPAAVTALVVAFPDGVHHYDHRGMLPLEIAIEVRHGTESQGV